MANDKKSIKDNIENIYNEETRENGVVHVVPVIVAEPDSKDENRPNNSDSKISKFNIYGS